MSKGKGMDWGDKLNLTILFLGAAAVTTSAAIGITYVAQPNEKVQVTVDKQERVQSKSGKTSKYLVFSEAGEVFENTDSWTRWKFNSSDVYGEMKPGCTYEATVFGFRNNFLSTYRDIVDVKHVPTDACPTPKGPKIK